MKTFDAMSRRMGRMAGDVRLGMALLGCGTMTMQWQS
jgi:hypothetical protein